MTYKPAAYPDLSPYPLVADVEASIDWLQTALGAKSLRLIPNAEGTIIHGEAWIGDSVLMLGRTPGQSGAHMHRSSLDPDILHPRALAAGGRNVQDMTEKCDGDRRGGVQAPDGTTWWFAKQLGDLDEA